MMSVVFETSKDVCHPKPLSTTRPIAVVSANLLRPPCSLWSRNLASEISSSGFALQSLPIPPAIHLENRNREAIPHFQPLIPAVVIGSEGALLEWLQAISFFLVQ
jgi:hypothetical protein